MSIFFRTDWRLTYYNLQQSGKIKNIGDEERNKIWIPNLIFDNSAKERLAENDKFSILAILQDSYGRQKTNEFLQENILHLGSNHFIVYSRAYLMDFGCEFEQHSYPFDSQTCSIQVIVL